MATDPPVDPHSAYQASEKNKDSKDKPADDSKVVEISEEDLKLKESLDASVATVQAPAASADEKRAALQSLVAEIRTSTSSMTSVPKPLKFLRPHYAPLKLHFAAMAAADANRTLLADVLSVLGMTMAADDVRESLNFRLLGSKEDLACWGHEYIRNLTGEIAAEHAARTTAAPPASVADLKPLVDQIVDFYLKHNAECDACDLMLEVDRLGDLVPLVSAEGDAHERIGAYLARCATFAGTKDERDELLTTAFRVYLAGGAQVHALRVALRLDAADKVQQALAACTDAARRKQMALVVGAQRFAAHGVEDDELAPLFGNASVRFCGVSANAWVLSRLFADKWGVLANMMGFLSDTCRL